MTRTILRLSLLAVLSLSAFACATDTDFSDDTIGSDASDARVRPVFDLWRSAGGADFYFHFVAGNGEILLSSEGYRNRSGALNGLLSVLDHGGFAGNYETFEGADGQWYINLVASNMQIIASSEGYATKSSANRAVDTNIANIASYLEHWDTAAGARFQVFENRAGEFNFNLYAANGAVMLSSESYTTEAAALNGAFSVAENGIDAANFDVVQSASGGYYLNLRAKNHQIIGTSEVYSSKSNALRAMDSIVELIPAADLL